MHAVIHAKMLHTKKKLSQFWRNLTTFRISEFLYRKNESKRNLTTNLIKGEGTPPLFDILPFEINKENDLHVLFIWKHST